MNAAGMRYMLRSIHITQEGASEMPRRNGQASRGRGYMKGRSGTRRGRASIGAHPMRYADTFVTPAISPDKMSTTFTNRESKRTRDTNCTDRGSAVALVDELACRGCGACVGACPENAISVGNDVAGIDARLCLGCAECIDSCPFGAISMAHNDN